MLANWGPICYFIAVLPASWLLDVKGLRTTVVTTAVLVAVGAGIRIASTSASAKTGTIFIHAGQFLNGLAGPVAMSSPPVVSSTFFPPRQRTIAVSYPMARNAQLSWLI